MSDLIEQWRARFTPCPCKECGPGPGIDYSARHRQRDGRPTVVQETFQETLERCFGGQVIKGGRRRRRLPVAVPQRGWGPIER